MFLFRQLKMAIVVRNDLRLTKGKIGAQCSHAAVIAFKQTLDEKQSLAEKWMFCGQPKIVLRVDSLDELEELEKKAENHSVICAKVKDAGRTQISPGTVTCIALGPDDVENIDALVKELKLL